MVKVSKEVAAGNRLAILQAVSAMIRQHGAGAASVIAIAKASGLTHGALYRHFPNKDAAVAAAVTFDFDRIIGVLDDLAAKGAGVGAYAGMYLAPDHRDHFPWGCPVAPLAAEIGRSAPDIAQAFHDGLMRNLDSLAVLAGRPGDRATAMAILAQLSGSLAMARATAVCDQALSDQIRAAGRDAAVALAAPRP